LFSGFRLCISIWKELLPTYENSNIRQNLIFV
jgi:hypothetical protein